jgi:hypothetical protein
MKIIKGDLWDNKAAITFVTGNSFLTKDGRLVMGRGAAKEALDKFPSIDSVFGQMIKYRQAHLGKYGILIDGVGKTMEASRYLGIFQVKYHFKDKADLSLIKYSAEELYKILVWFPSVAINFPGIGFGQRTMEEVLPIISFLPDNVTFYIKD